MSDAMGTSSASFQRTLDRFTVGLTPKEKEDFKLSSLQDVYDEINRIQCIHGDDKKMRNLNRLKGFVEAMDQYGKVIETFLNTSNFIAFVWGPLKFMLQIASTWAESLDTLLDAYEQIGENLPQFQLYEALFKDDLRVRALLELVYEDILEFHRRALKFLSCKAWKKVFQSAWKTFDTRFRNILARLQNHKRLLERQADLTTIEDLRAQRLRTEEMFQQLEDSELKRRHTAVRDKLRPANSSLDQEHTTGKRSDYPDTGQWFLQSDKFEKWKSFSNVDEPVLWLNGIPGAGKTVLTSLIIEHLTTLGPSSLAYFYCRHQDLERNSFAAVLRGIIMQLVQQNEALLAHVYERCCRSSEVSLETSAILKELIEVSLQTSGNVFVVIDGIDECESREASKVVTLFKSIVRDNQRSPAGAYKVLFVSQRDGSLDKLLSKIPMVALDGSSGHREDIHKYARQWWLKIQEKFALTQEHQNQIVETITGRANGMFLFVKLVLTNLLDQTSRARLNKELQPENIPKGLEEAYERVVRRIYHNPKVAEREDAKTIFAWLACMKRPLQWREIQAVFSIDIESRTVDVEERHLCVTVKDLCSSLVELRPEGAVEFAHGTVRQYLIDTHRVNPIDGNARIASFCMRYLTFDCFKANILDVDVASFLGKGYYVFEAYAISHWLDHLQSATNQPPGDARHLASTAESFLRQHWIGDYEHLPDIPSSHTLRPNFGGMRNAGHLNFLLALNNDKKADTDYTDLHSQLHKRRVVYENSVGTLSPERKKDLEVLYGLGWFRCPKPWCDWFFDGFRDAATRDKHVGRHERPFLCTFEGCPITELGCESSSELSKHVSTYHSLTGAVFPTSSQLQEKHWKKWSPKLSQAVQAGSLSDIESILKMGIDPNMSLREKQISRTALEMAIKGNQKLVVEKLLEYGANPNETNQAGDRILTVAIQMGDIDIVRLLLEFGAEDWPNTADPALHTAIRLGQKGAVRVLLSGERRTKINAKNKTGITALHEAITQLNKDIVMLLLDMGAKPEEATPFGATSLVTAFQCRNDPSYWADQIEIMQLLLDHGACTPQEGDVGASMLADATEAGWHQVVVLLLGHGADPNVMDASGRTPLCVAAKKERVEILQTLVENGRIQVDKPDDAGNTPLYAGSMSAEITRMLLAKGADVNARNSDGNTPLHQACCNGNGDVVRLLKGSGANLDCLNSAGKSVLDMALQYKHGSIVVDLVLSGVSFDEKTVDTNTIWLLRDLDHICKAVLEEIVLRKAGKRSFKGVHDRKLLHFLAQSVNACAPRIARLLLERGSDIDERDDWGQTPLYSAIDNGNWSLADFLLDNNASVMAQNEMGRTCLHVLGYSESRFRKYDRKRSLRIAGRLLEMGANIDAKDEFGNTPLHSSSVTANLKYTKFLLETGANVNAQNADLQTPLHISCCTYTFTEKVYQLFIDHGANEELLDRWGQRPRDNIRLLNQERLFERGGEEEVIVREV